MKLNKTAFALTCAITWGFYVMALTWWIILLDGPSEVPTFLGRVYRGYTLTLKGSLIGCAWGFADGLIGGFIIAWLYNLISEKNEPLTRKNQRFLNKIGLGTAASNSATCIKL